MDIFSELQFVLDVAPDRPEIEGIGDILGLVMNLLMGLGIGISAIFIGLAGIKFITSGGDPKAVDQSKRALTYAIVAAIISVGALAFRIILLQVIGVEGQDLIDPVPSF